MCAKQNECKVNHKGSPTLFCCLLLAGGMVRADNITVANVTLVSASPTESIVQFDIAWDNSWRTVLKADDASTENWDAAWVFVDYHLKEQSGAWRRATLAKDGHQAPADATIAVGTSGADDAAFGAGVFIHRSAVGEAGPNDWKGVKLRWLHPPSDESSGAAGETGAIDTNTTIPEVTAIEMVYVPQGAFWAGDGLTTRGRFTKTQITQADPTTDGGRPAGALAPENGNTLWPNGYKGFYCMKSEITHRDFLRFQKALADPRFALYPPRKDLTDPPDRNAPRGWLSWHDGAGFAAWAGLRPMTELEYEKAGRGPLAPVAGEYAWGSTNRLPAAVAAAAASNSGVSREQTGASFWGILDLSGGLWDRVVTLDDARDYPTDQGRRFRGTHGTGSPDLPDDWPDTEGNGAGFRGGAAGLAPVHMGISDRYSAAYGNGSRGMRNGFRAVRTAP